MKTFKIIISALIILTLVNGCGDLFFTCFEGNGIFATEERAVTSFDRIISSGEFDVIIDGDTTEQYIRIEGDENLIERVIVRVRSGVLYIELEDGDCISPELGMKIYVGSNILNYIELEGAGNIFIDDLSEDNFEAIISGSGNINLNDCIISNSTTVSIEGTGNVNATGKTTNVEYNIEGSGNIYASGFKSSNCVVEIDGSGYAYVHAYSTLDVEIDGTGTVYYTGTVSEENVTIDIDGYGEVRRQNN